MISQYVQLDVNVEVFEGVTDTIANLNRWYTLFSDQSEGVIGIVPTKEANAKTTPLAGLFLSEVEAFEGSVPLVFWVTLLPSTNRVELNVYEYEYSSGVYQEIHHSVESENTYGEDICEKVQAEYGRTLRFDWDKFVTEYSFAREV